MKCAVDVCMHVDMTALFSSYYDFRNCFFPVIFCRSQSVAYVKTALINVDYVCLRSSRGVETFYIAILSHLLLARLSRLYDCDIAL